MAKYKIKRLKGASRLDAAVRGMASIVDLGGMNMIEVVPPKGKLPSVYPARKGWARGPALPPSKLKSTYESICIKDARGRTLRVRNVVESHSTTGGKSAGFKVYSTDALSAGSRSDTSVDV